MAFNINCDGNKIVILFMFDFNYINEIFAYNLLWNI